METNIHQQTPNIDTNTRNTHRGRYLALLILVIGGAVASPLIAPAAAQGVIVTPLPGPAATATAAAQGMAEARARQAQGAAMKVAADAARAHAAQLEQSGNDAIAEGTTSYQIAADNAARATAALQAQQFDVASEMIARAQSNIETGRSQINEARGVVTQLRGIVDAQSATIITLMAKLQQADAYSQTLIVAQRQQEQDGQTSAVVSIFTGLLMFMFLFGLLAWGWQVVQRRRNGVTIVEHHEADVIDNED